MIPPSEPTEPIETKWQTVVQARGEHAAQLLAKYADKPITDEFLKTLSSRHAQIEVIVSRASFYSVLMLFVLFVTRYAPIAEISWAGIKITEIKGFSEALLFISSVFIIFAWMFAVQNGVRKAILQESIKIKYGDQAHEIASTAYVEDYLLRDIWVRPENQYWTGFPQALFVAFMVGMAICLVILVGIQVLIRLIVIADVYEAVRLPPLVHYTVIGTAIASIILDILGMMLMYVPMPYRDSGNSKAFYALRESDPNRFYKLFDDWLLQESRREVRKDRISSAMFFFLGYTSFQLISGDIEKFLNVNVVLQFFVATLLTSFVGGAIVTSLNRKITRHIYGNHPSDDAKFLAKYNKVQKINRALTFSVPLLFVFFFFLIPDVNEFSEFIAKIQLR